MKLLYICAKDVNKVSNGGELCTNRNYLSFCSLLGHENVDVFNLMENVKFGIKNTVFKRLNYIFGLFEGLDKENIKNIISVSSKYDIVFIDTSIYGIIAKHLKQNEYKGKIITFFHNIEYEIMLQKLKSEPWKLPEWLVIHKNEKEACRFSDSIITLNARDKDSLKKLYGKRDYKIIPISLKDTFDIVHVDKTSNKPPVFLFTGNNWYANIHGINWFIENVLDHVNIKLQITGAKMDALKDKYNHPKIEFLGFVDDLGEVIKKADFILAPVFIGSGMKVKTCEALMYGKNIIATKESFMGYDVEIEKVGVVCNTKEEFIEAIHKYCNEPVEKYNSNSREYFLNKYSFEATLEQFKELI